MGYELRGYKMVGTIATPGGLLSDDYDEVYHCVFDTAEEAGESAHKLLDCGLADRCYWAEERE